jgi:hypothetical protein
MSWYQSGYEGIGQEEARIQAQRGPNRIWIKGGTGKDLVLVDDEAFCIYEHNAKINGNWRNHHTCMRGFEDPCKSCEELGDRSRYYTGYLTTVDCSLWEDNKGNKYQYEVKLCGGKLGQLKKWKRKKEDKGALTMTKWKVHREDNTKPSTGDEWEYDGEVKSPEKLFELANYRGKKLSDLWDEAEAEPAKMDVLKQTFQLEFDEEGKLIRKVVPFNYMEVLKPRGNQFVKDMLSGVSRDEALGNTDDSKGSGGSEGAEDDVPF